MTRCCLLVLLLGVALVPAAPVTIVVDTPMPAPAWARLERQLLADNVPACREFFEKYYDERGYLQVFLRWGANDGPDDAFENFNRWPELHALGADDEILRLYLRGLGGHDPPVLRGEDDRRAGRARRHVREGLLRAVGLDAPRRGPAALQPHGALGARPARVPRSRAPLRGALHGRGSGRAELRPGEEADSLDDQRQPRPDAAARRRRSTGSAIRSTRPASSPCTARARTRSSSSTTRNTPTSPATTSSTSSRRRCRPTRSW